MSKQTMNAGGRRKKHKKGPVLCAAAILALASLVSTGRGHGNGDGTGKNQESASPSPEEIIPSPTKAVPTIESTLTPEPEVVLEEIFVKIDKSDIFCGDKKFADVQALIEYIRQQAEGKEIENTCVVLDDTSAVANTFEDVKSALEQNGIPWITPTTAP